MSVIEQAVEKSKIQTPEGVGLPASISAPSQWAWLPNLVMFVLLAVVLWNYLSERDYRRQMEARLETTISDLETTRQELRSVQSQHQEMEDLLHAELEASNGRIAKMRFDLDQAKKERDSADAARAAAQDRVQTLEAQNHRLHQVIQSLRRRGSPAPAGSLAWDSGSPSSST